MKRTPAVIGFMSVIVFMYGIGATHISAQDRRPVASIMPLVEEQMAQQCSLGRQRLAAATEGLAKEQAGSMVKISCDCMPRELERAKADLSGGDDQAMVTQEAFLSRMRVALSACAARLLRAEIGDRCEAETERTGGVTNIRAYCRCVSDRLRRVDDETLATASTVAQQNFETRARARAQGQPDPTPVPTAIDEIKEECKKS
jgi:hypothetical protein